jgi:ssRNA-specific RNase YbeY (16S rRNA maturation enzyme)
MLHLCGFNDKAQEEIKVIRNKEEEYLKMFGFT